jgi:hypothetical protein
VVAGGCYSIPVGHSESARAKKVARTPLAAPRLRNDVAMTVADTHLYFSVYAGPRPAALTVQRSEERAMPRE